MLHDRAFADLSAAELYPILVLRSEVFVVEQTCVFLDLDGRDTEPGARHLWIEHDGRVDAVARVLVESPETRRIGRIVTRPSHRGQGLAAQLIEHAIASFDGEFVLDGQSHLADYYRRFGFEPSGAEYLEDGIPHIPMRRPA